MMGGGQELLSLAAHHVDLGPEVVDQQQDQVHHNRQSQYHGHCACSWAWLTPVQDEVNVAIAFAGIKRRRGIKGTING